MRFINILDKINVNRITSTINSALAKGTKVLVTYIVSGDPRPSTTLGAMHALVKAGADIIELGIPFSDPMAEGDVIQRGHERALAYNTSLKSSMLLVEEFRKTDSETPIILMGYANPIERMGYAEFAKEAARVGVDGLLTVDLPPEEASGLVTALRNESLENIFLIAPTSTNERIEKISSLAGGFLYYVSLKGVTGAGHLNIDSVSHMTQKIKSYSSLPIFTGFGIKDAASAKAVGAVSDGVVIGSALVAVMSDLSLSDEDIYASLSDLVSPIRSALDELV